MNVLGSGKYKSDSGVRCINQFIEMNLLIEGLDTDDQRVVY